jgi:hypothetical protein
VGALAMNAVCCGAVVPCAVFAWTEFDLTLHPLVIQAEIRNVDEYWIFWYNMFVLMTHL